MITDAITSPIDINRLAPPIDVNRYENLLKHSWSLYE